MSFPWYFSLTLIFDIAKSAWDNDCPLEFILTNISVTSLISNEDPKSIHPIDILFIESSLFILLLTSLASISNLDE